VAQQDVLLDACKARRLAVFAGSGISALPPAFLPNWRDFNEAVLHAVKNLARTFCKNDREVEAALDVLSLDLIPVQVFSDCLVDGFAGGDYFPVLDVLDGVASNANHHALAELAARGVLRAIVTTNFDTLIERAFTERQVGLRVYARAEDFETAPDFDHGCVLYKIHGSVGEHTTLVDTVSQKIRGLGPAKRRHLQAVYQDFHTLVAGFSGADLSFGEDYLAFDALRTQDPLRPRLTWVLRQGDPARPPVRQLLDALHCEPLLGVLPGVFEALGAPVEDGSADNPELRETIGQRVRSLVAERLGTGGDLPFRAALFCASMLRTLGQPQVAMGLVSRLEEEAARATVPWFLVVLTHLERARLALEQMDEAGAAAATGAARQLIDAQAGARDGKAGSEERILFARADASCGSLAGLLAELAGDKPLARASLERAIDAALNADSPGLTASLIANLSQAVRHEGDVDRALALVRESAEMGRRAAFPQAICMAALQEASLFLELGEYDAAQTCLDAARSHLAWGADDKMRAQLEVTEATILYRRGHPEDAWQRWHQLFESLTGQPVLRADLTLTIVSMLARVATIRDGLLDSLQAARESLESSGGETARESLRQRLSDMERQLQDGTLKPGPLVLAARDDEDLELRHKLISAEVEDDAAAAESYLSQLMQRALAEQRYPRAYDLAKGALARARVTGDEAMTAKALVFAGMTCSFTGDHQTALGWFSQAHDMQHALSPGGRLQLDEVRSIELLRAGDVEPALEQAEAVIVEYVAQDALTAAVNVILDVGRLLMPMDSSRAARWLVDHKPTCTSAGIEAEQYRQELLAQLTLA